MSWGLVALLALLLGLLVPSIAHGAGELDPSFDGDGKVLTDFGQFDEASGVAVQADGKVVASGARFVGGFFTFALARYNQDGSLDPTFDGDGRVATSFGGFAVDVAIQADGKIVAAGFTPAAVNRNFVLARFNPDGSLDTTFDGDGRVLTDFGGYEEAHGLAIQADGKVVAAGFRVDRAGVGVDFALARYNPDGSLDPTFDGDGRVEAEFFLLATGTEAIAIQADGKIVAAGGLSEFVLARFNPDGSLDPSFGSGGRVLTDFGATAKPHGLVIQADGKIVAAGESFAGDNPRNFALARYNADGSLDSTFEGDGTVVTDIGADEDFGARDVAIQADGKIVAAGRSPTGPNPYNFALARYLPGPANRPPDCSTAGVSPNMLRPPNHDFRLATLSGATDPDGDPVTLTITGVTQDEAVNAEDDGNTSPDATPASAGDEVFLRAERSGTGNGRVYSIAFTASDGKGGTCDDTTTVPVPLSSSSQAIDSAPPSYDSFGL